MCAQFLRADGLGIRQAKVQADYAYLLVTLVSEDCCCVQPAVKFSQLRSLLEF